MALLSLQNANIRFGGEPLLEDVTLNIEEGDHVCILGANGAGKSTLLKILSGKIEPDTGDMIRSAHVRLAYLPQDVPADREGTTFDVVAEGEPEDESLASRIDRVLKRQGIDPAAPFSSLSGGNRRRTLLAKALLHEPDVLMLDEPTNHLDIESVQWLEENLPRMVRTFVFVTHDRAFLRRMANRILELDRGRVLDWACDYDRFLIRKEEALQEERKNWERFDVKLRQEEAWLRQGVKARTHRNQGRLRHLLEMRKEREARRTPSGSVTFSIQEAERSGNLVLRAQGVRFGYPGAGTLLRNVDTDIRRGDRVGIMGPNGCGKTTLVRLLLGNGLEPDAGTIRRGTNLEILYSDQLRGQLKLEESIADNVAEGREYVMINGVRRHILSYLSDFLFGPERAGQKVSSLSGGERSRLLMAKLFAQPSNVLVLDEPTNDLDLDTVDLLEEQLDAYQGTVILVSHDRAFLNEVVTSSLVFEKYQPESGTWLGAGEGWSVNEYPGGYDHWVEHRKTPPPPEEKAVRKPAEEKKAPTVRRLSYNEKRELEALPAKIEALEKEIAEIGEALSNPEVFRSRPEDAMALTDRLPVAESELNGAYERWTALEEIANG